MPLFLKKFLELNLDLPTPITIEFYYFRQYKPKNKQYQPRPANYTSKDGTKRLRFFPKDEFSLLDQEEQTSSEGESDGTRSNSSEDTSEADDDVDETDTGGTRCNSSEDADGTGEESSDNSSEDASEPDDDTDGTDTEESSYDDNEDVNKLADMFAKKSSIK